MVEINQFGSAQPGSAQVCGRCETLLMDVLDGAATAEDQAFFDAHVASCAGCSEMLADAQRGGAWLEMLRDPRPEPPAALFDRILAQTSGLAAGGTFADYAPVDAVSRGGSSTSPLIQMSPSAGGYSNAGSAVPHTVAGMGFKVLPFRLRGAAHGVRQTMLQPRLAMTAAMAFFSIALTLNLTGVRVSALRLSDLRPSNLRREFYTANAHVVRYCDNLRVVYELEARTHELQRTSENDGQSGSSSSDDGRPKEGNGADDQPADQQKRPPDQPKPGPGTSRRETRTSDQRLVAASPELFGRASCISTFLSTNGRNSTPTMHLKGDSA